MRANDYHFVTHWAVRSTVEAVSEIIGDATDLVRWWPSVYLDVRELEPGDGDGVGKVLSLHTKGWLPYTLHWQFRVTESREPFGYTLNAWGDLIGRGVWDFMQMEDLVDIRYDWQVSAAKPLLRRLSFLLKPVFSANHHWAMRMGEESLKLELARRHSRDAIERDRVPAPPQPTFARWFRRGKAWETIRGQGSSQPELAG